jgi:hypothetical protein
MEAAPHPPKSPKSSEPSPRTSLSDRLGGLVSNSRPGTPPSASRSPNHADAASGLRRAVLESANDLEKLPPARVTTPRPNSPLLDSVPNAATRSKLTSDDAGKATDRVEAIYAPSAIQSLHDALSDELVLSVPKRSPSASSTNSSMPPSFLSSRTPRLLDALTRTTMPTASLSVPPRAYLHTPIASPFRDTQRATEQTEAVLNPPVASAQSSPLPRRAESPATSPTLLGPTRSSIDTLRGTLKRSESMHTTASQGKSFGSWWFGESKKEVDHLLDEADRAETAEQEREGFRSKCRSQSHLFCCAPL